MNPFRKLRALFRKEKLDAEMSEEMRTHLELQVAQNISHGMEADEARFAALRQFGNVSSIQNHAREQRGWVWLENWQGVLRQAARSLGRSPGFSLSVFLTLMLCLGPNTAVLAALALVLAAVGIYGVMAYSVAQRTREIGIRLALGATPRGILQLVLGQSLRVVVVGLVIGLAAALALSRVFGSLLYDVAPRDPFTFAVVSLLLFGVALVATLLPARRAVRVDPMVTLRAE